MCAVACERLRPVEFLQARCVVLETDGRQRIVAGLEAQEVWRHGSELVTPIELRKEAADVSFFVAANQLPTE